MNQSMQLKSVLFLFIIGLASGCVSASKFHDLEDTSAACQKDRDDLKAKLDSSTSTVGSLSNEKSKLEGTNSQLKTALAELQARKLETEKRLAEFKELTEKFKTLVDSGKLSIKFHDGRMVIALSTDILFPSGSALLSEEGKSAIKEVTGVLKELNNKKFQIEGHTDNVPIHSAHFPSNWELASARATSVLNTMLAEGFAPDHVSTASYASYDPISDNSSAKGRGENRRIAIVIVPDLSGLPGFDQLNRMSNSENSK